MLIHFNATQNNIFSHAGISKVLYSTETFGTFEENEKVGSIAFCRISEGGNLHVEDYNGDRLWDILCHSPDGRVEIYYNQGGIKLTS